MTVSRESQSIIDYIESTGLAYRVTDVNGPGHAAGSWHYAKGTGGTGTAVDFAGAVPGVTLVTARQMAAIYRALLNVAGQLAELIYSGVDVDGRPVITAVHQGRRVDGASFYSPAVWRDHFDHVHVAVPRGVFLTPLSQPSGTVQGGQMPDDPNLPNIAGPVQFATAGFDQDGVCTGYYIFSHATGELHSFGPGARFYGRSEVIKLVAT